MAIREACLLNLLVAVVAEGQLDLSSSLDRVSPAVSPPQSMQRHVRSQYPGSPCLAWRSTELQWWLGPSEVPEFRVISTTPLSSDILCQSLSKTCQEQLRAGGRAAQPPPLLGQWLSAEARLGRRLSTYS